MRKRIFLFLDFDGVLHPYGCKDDLLMCKRKIFEDVLIKHKSIHIVISSSWKNVKSLDEMKSLFSPEISERIIGVTPTLKKDDEDHYRFIEIQKYMEGQSVHDWVAVDDNYKSFPRGCYNLIRCNPRTGIDEGVLRQLSFRLNIMASSHRH